MGNISPTRKKTSGVTASELGLGLHGNAAKIAFDKQYRIFMKKHGMKPAHSTLNDAQRRLYKTKRKKEALVSKDNSELEKAPKDTGYKWYL